MGLQHRANLLGKLDAIEIKFPGMPPGLLDLVRSCASSIAGSQRVDVFANALKKGRLDRYRHRHHNHKRVPVIETVTEAWNDFTRFNDSTVMVTS
jgi:hypothetical protein